MTNSVSPAEANSALKSYDEYYRAEKHRLIGARRKRLLVSGLKVTLAGAVLLGLNTVALSLLSYLDSLYTFVDAVSWVVPLLTVIGAALVLPSVVKNSRGARETPGLEAGLLEHRQAFLLAHSEGFEGHAVDHLEFPNPLVTADGSYGFSVIFDSHKNAEAVAFLSVVGGDYRLTISKLEPTIHKAKELHS